MDCDDHNADFYVAQTHRPLQMGDGKPCRVAKTEYIYQNRPVQMAKWAFYAASETWILVGGGIKIQSFLQSYKALHVTSHSKII